MKYGESLFDICYLALAIICGCLILKKSRTGAEKRMGFATLILGCGDAFHLVPRVLNYFIEADFTAALGIGKLVTSITMTLFYVLLYYIWLGYYHKKENRTVTIVLWALLAARLILCMFPQNGWLRNESGVTWGILRNIPFVLLGAVVAYLYFTARAEARRFKWIWLYVVLSFLFYIPVAVAAGIVPILGMLMLPKTVCYILLILTFRAAVVKDEAR